MLYVQIPYYVARDMRGVLITGGRRAGGLVLGATLVLDRGGGKHLVPGRVRMCTRKPCRCTQTLIEIVVAPY